MSEATDYQMRQIDRGSLAGTWRGAAGDDLVDCYDLAQQVLGAGANDPDTGQFAFFYLYRRFGAPTWTYDDHKEIGAYCLSTPDPEVCLIIRGAVNAIALSVAYAAVVQIRDEHHRPMVEWADKIAGWLADQVAAERPDLVTERDENGQPTALSKDGWQMVRERRYDPGPDKWGPASWTGRAIAVVGEPPHDSETAAARRVKQALAAALGELPKPVRIRDAEINLLGRVGRKRAAKP